MQCNAASDFADYVYKRARKVFGILICIGKGRFITTFTEHGISDKNLPMDIPKGASQQKIWMSTVGAFRGFSHRELDGFARVQWSFAAPFFAKQEDIIVPYEFDDRVILPFIEDTEHEARSGGFSEVWSVVIHPAHHMLLESVS